MTFAEYAALDAVNWSTLKAMADSPLAYKHGLTKSREDSPVLAFGRLSHTALFEPDTLKTDYAVYDGDGDKASKDYKAFVVAHPGVEVVKAKDYARALALGGAVRSHPLVRPMLAGADPHERTVVWQDPKHGFACKSRLDWTRKRDGLLVDLKTARTIAGHAFSRQVANLRYGGQLAFYERACLYGERWEPVTMRFVVVESAPPHDVAVYELDPESLEYCREVVADLLAKLAECRASGKWPGRYDTVQTLEVPRWMAGEEGMTVTYDEDP